MWYISPSGTWISFSTRNTYAHCRVLTTWGAPITKICLCGHCSANHNVLFTWLPRPCLLVRTLLVPFSNCDLILVAFWTNTTTWSLNHLGLQYILTHKLCLCRNCLKFLVLRRRTYSHKLQFATSTFQAIRRGSGCNILIYVLNHGWDPL